MSKQLRFLRWLFVPAVSLGATLAFAYASWDAAKDPAGQSCEVLAQRTLADAKVMSAQVLAAGAFTPPPSPAPRSAGVLALYSSMPAICRLQAEAAPSADSNIKIEVWMPAANWNGKFQAVGNGGFAGSLDYALMAMAIARGYAAASTDTGHSGSAVEAGWALNHPEKITDFGYRAIHVMTEVAKAAVAAYYGKSPRYSYFAGCSNGGRQALMEAQRFPRDYDGILAGAPANYWTHLLTSALWNAQATARDDASYIPSAKLPAIAAAVRAACDAQDGITDGILNDPRQCQFDPATLLCRGGDSEKCLTAPQVTALKALYDGPVDSAGNRIFPGLLPGGEEGEGGWSLWITGRTPGTALLFFFANGYFSDMVFSDPAWNYKTADITQSVKASDAKFAGILNATDSDLRPFQAHGGKLVIYHGWDDVAISPPNAIDYYNAVRTKMGSQKTDSFLRLYMVPGMQHCAGGPGTDAFGQTGMPATRDSRHDIQLALEDWVEKKTAPAEIIAAKYTGEGPSAEVKMTRPLCPYPEAAKYKGSGDSDKAENFSCEKSEK